MNTDFDYIDLSSFEITENDITAEEISLLTNNKSDDFDKDRYLKASGKLIDNGLSPKGYGIHSNGLEYMANHFQETKNVRRLHRMFKNHDYQDVDSKIGRITDIFTMDSYESLDYEGVLDTNDTTVKEKADTYDEVSATVFLNDWRCSGCQEPLRRLTRNRNIPITDRFEFQCNHEPDGKKIYPEAHKAIHFETSPVTVGNYQTSIEVASFSGVEEYLDGIMDENEIEDEEGDSAVNEAMKQATVEGDMVTMSLSSFKSLFKDVDSNNAGEEEEEEDEDEGDDSAEDDLDEAIVNAIVEQINKVNKLDNLEQYLNSL